MGFPIATKMTFSVSANSDSADIVIPTYQIVGRGNLKLITKASAIGLNAVLKLNGVPLADNVAIPYTGTTGTISKVDNVLVDQMVAGGRTELFFRNTTGGALTVDAILEFTPGGK